jgi:hypothetical protein
MCHSERSEESAPGKVEILRSAQDGTCNIQVGKAFSRPPVLDGLLYRSGSTIDQYEDMIVVSSAQRSVSSA